MDRTCVLILGMHRSGTSALAGVLQRMGVDFGAELIGANPGNPLGHFEMESAVAFDDRMLRHFRSRWKRSFALPDDWRGRMPDEFASFRLAMPEGRVWGLKDPRMCRLVPVWKEILARHDSAVRFVLCLRNPGEVAASLASRDGIPASQGLALWVEHLCAAEADTRDEARMFVDYSDLLTNGIQTASRIAEFIGLPFRKSAVEFLDPNLRRERADLEPPPVCRELHRLAKSDGTELRNMVDEIRALLSFREHAVRTERKSLLERLK